MTTFTLWKPPSLAPPATVKVEVCEHVDCRIRDGDDPFGSGMVAASKVDHAKGNPVMLRNIFGPRDEPLDRDTQEKWCAGFLAYFVGSTPVAFPNPRIICIDHARFKERRSDDAQLWMIENLLFLLNEALPDTVVTMYGVEAWSQTWFRWRKPDRTLNAADPDPDRVPWIRAIGAVNGEDLDGDGHKDPETVAGFTARVATAISQGHERVVVWFDHRKPPTEAEWRLMWNAIQTAQGVAMQPVPRPSWLQRLIGGGS